MSRARIADMQNALDRIRAERVSLAAALATLAGDVAGARAAAESAKVNEVIAPGGPAASQARGAEAALAAAVEKRDAAEVRAELLDKAAAKLGTEIQDLDREVRRAERAAAVVELNRRLEEGRTQARAWIVWAVAAEMLRGTIVTDAGLAAIQALEPVQPSGAVVNAISASAAALRERIDAGEALP